MELNFYTSASSICLLVPRLGSRDGGGDHQGRAFVNRGVASGPFCFVYGTAAVLMAVGFATCARRRWPLPRLCGQRHVWSG